MIEEKIQKYFANQKNVAAVYLFGSYASGKQRPGSDVDVAVLLAPYEPQTENVLRTRFMAELSRLTRMVIHPVILNSAGEALLKQVLKNGKCLQANDPKALSHFKMTAIARIAEYGYYLPLFQQGVIRQINGGEHHDRP